jgi:hypothetical protein
MMRRGDVIGVVMGGRDGTKLANVTSVKLLKSIGAEMGDEVGADSSDGPR